MTTLRTNNTFRIFAVAAIFAALMLSIFGNATFNSQTMPTASASAVNVYVKFDGGIPGAPIITGSSSAVNHPKEIEAVSYDSMIENKTTIGSGATGVLAGKADFSTIRFSKKVDAASVSLNKAVAIGTHYGTVTVTFNNGAGDVYQVVLGTVYVTSVQQMVNNGDGINEVVTLEVGQITWKNLSSTTDKAGWDIVKNIAL